MHLQLSLFSTHHWDNRQLLNSEKLLNYTESSFSNVINHIRFP